MIDYLYKRVVLFGATLFILGHSSETKNSCDITNKKNATTQIVAFMVVLKRKY